MEVVMCQCGCSDGGPDYKIKGPDNTWYGIRIYAGCRDCDSPIGIDIFLLTRENYYFFDVKELPVLQFFDNMSSIPVLYPRQLIDAMNADGLTIDEDEYSEGDVSDMMRSACFETVNEWEQLVSKKNVKRKKK